MSQDISKTEGDGECDPSSQDQTQNADMCRKPPPTLATLFQPGNYGIVREILTHMEISTFNNLKKAAKTDKVFFHNLLHTPMKALWTCQEHDYQVFPAASDDDFLSEPTRCSNRHTQACEGFELGIPSGLAHGPLHAVCTLHSEQIAKQLANQWNWNEIWDDGVLSSVPFQRITDPVDQPSHACNCEELNGGFRLCRPCRYDVRSIYLYEVIQAAEKCAESCEWITRREPKPSDHILGHEARFCRICRGIWREEPEAHYMLNSWIRVEAQRDRRIHYSQESAQVFRCLHCKGGMRGWAICGREGRGGYSRFGVGRRLKPNLPWIEYNHPEE